MTREEAIKWLVKPTVTSTEVSPTKAKELEAYNMAIDALSAETSINLVSREDVVREFIKLFGCIQDVSDIDEWADICQTTVNEIPSTKIPNNTPTTDLISRTDAIEAVAEDLASVLNVSKNETRELAEHALSTLSSAKVVSREVYEKRIQADERIIDSYRREFAEATSAEAMQGDGRNNMKRYPNCHMRTSLGNCGAIGGFCTSINAPTCDAFHKLVEAIHVSGDLISRADAIEAVAAWTVEDRPTEVMPIDLVGRLNSLPSAEAVPKHDVEIITDEITKRISSAEVIQGEWKLDPNGIDWNIPAWRCSECGFVANYIGVAVNDLGNNPMSWAGSNFCPNCGAKMTFTRIEKGKSHGVCVHR